jgi:hypothetical protein
MQNRRKTRGLVSISTAMLAPLALAPAQTGPDEVS